MQIILQFAARNIRQLTYAGGGRARGDRGRPMGDKREAVRADAALRRPALDPGIPRRDRDLLASRAAPLTASGRDRAAPRRCCLPVEPARRLAAIEGTVAGLTAAGLTALLGGAPLARRGQHHPPGRGTGALRRRGRRGGQRLQGRAAGPGPGRAARPAPGHAGEDRRRRAMASPRSKTCRSRPARSAVCSASRRSVSHCSVSRRSVSRRSVSRCSVSRRSVSHCSVSRRSASRRSMSRRSASRPPSRDPGAGRGGTTAR